MTNYTSNFFDVVQQWMRVQGYSIKTIMAYVRVLENLHHKDAGHKESQRAEGAF